MTKLAILLALTFVLSGCAPAQVGGAAPVKVFFAGENGSVKTALDLAVQGHSHRSMIKDSFRFGFLEMLGGVLIAVGAAVEIWVTQKGLVNYSETWGNWLPAGNFLLAFTVSANLFDGIMPGWTKRTRPPT